MPSFLTLPRELRDLIYTSLLLSTLPLPTLSSTSSPSLWTHIQDPPSIHHGDWGSAFSLSRPPSTCAAFLVCSRQIHAEMMQAIEWVRRKGRLEARLDCIALDESFHYFTWLGVPLVRTETDETRKGAKGTGPTWTERVWGRCRFLAGAHGGGCNSAKSSSRCTSTTTTTTIERLWIDVRIHGDRRAKWRSNQSGPERTSWAVCAALKRLFEGGLGCPEEAKGSCVMVGDLIVNIVPPTCPPSPLPSTSTSTSTSPSTPTSTPFLPANLPLSTPANGTVHPHSVARELTDVWNKIWAGDEFRAGFYSVLLERIGRVRVCVDGEGGWWRGVRGELERGRAERRRIVERGGW